MRASGSRLRIAARVGVGAALAWGMIGGRAGADDGPWRSGREASEGARLFATDWSRADLRGRAGDGLGPLFNERSCLACHGQGGPGGSGGSRSDVTILSEAGTPRRPDGSIDREALVKPDRTVKPTAADVISDFAKAPSLVLHRFGNDPGYGSWRSEALQSFGLEPRPRFAPPRPGVGDSRVRISRRNTPALFGSGLIDSIPESAIREAARRGYPGFEEVKGRPNQLEDGRIGRFGWKAQTAGLGDFVRIACANELGLENPGHAQPPDPLRPGYKAPGPDLTEAECASLTGYVASLPRPIERESSDPLRAAHVDQGRRLFDSIGCAACHAPKLGEVDGIYSDLLLHDMGQGLSDAGEYYGSPISTPTPGPGLASVPPKASEWRTPPLWGLRDSAPYLHDGRAATIAGAIDLHGGQASGSANRYRSLDRRKKGYLDEFLLSLAAPPKAGRTR